MPFIYCESRRLLTTVKMDADLIELLTQNLSRLDETSETDRAGVYYILSEFDCTKPMAIY